ncbi:hypothetical protein E8E12_005039 [Didymella heteroderae]|uniref:Uncharacterized protein n=1 Tax=Didymella heteroderae TaxID=1769908 RepID=A0A9P4WU08_9PLEO|nr:hypothetical protein E8E12_005039 [Didymella heteroderae]
MKGRQSVRATFNNASERTRDLTVGVRNMLPSTLYRTFYESSATLSSRVSKDTHVRHRENEQLKLRPGNAFQTVGEVHFNDSLTKEGIERQLVWNKKENPSTWISMFNELSHAKRRAHFQYGKSKRIGQRVTIAEISTVDLIAATIHATCVSVWEILVKDKYIGWDLHYSVTRRNVQIPIWVHKSVRPADGSSITPDQLMDSCPDLFVSIQELRQSNLVDGPQTHSRRRTIRAHGHNYEWLALGRIRESRILKVIPFDGKIFHMTKPTSVVRSEAATEDWIFDFDLETWRLESEMNKAGALRRKRADADDGHAKYAKRKGDGYHPNKKNAHGLDFSTITTIFDSI